MKAAVEHLVASLPSKSPADVHAKVEADSDAADASDSHEACPDPDSSGEPTLQPKQSWKDLAMCNGQVEVFFGPAKERPERKSERLELAAAYCSLCSVSAQCRDAGRQNHEHGFWGGESELDRARSGFTPRSPSRRSVIAARNRFRSENQQDGSGQANNVHVREPDRTNVR